MKWAEQGARVEGNEADETNAGSEETGAQEQSRQRKAQLKKITKLVIASKG